MIVWLPWIQVNLCLFSSKRHPRAGPLLTGPPRRPCGKRAPCAKLGGLMQQKSSLEATLREVHERYSTKLVGLQSMVTGLQAQMTLLTASINENNLKYGTLLDLKTRLEAEIVEYRRLLDGEDDSSKTVITKVITVQETFVDGKKVESSTTKS
ncbi:hypothetical protein ILYODFUR_005495 [Ilyodon furcidens]|uniref:IF rod domain-containing protein n=1 Tax=Ilyodon furcidens TaxID=33524 RepID=A0ABV0TS80_9TELE